MWPFKKKIIVKETKKVYPYGRMSGSSQNFSVWDSMSFIEQIALIILPLGLVFLVYMMTEVAVPQWHFVFKLILSIGITSIAMSLIYWLASWMAGDA